METEETIRTGTVAEAPDGGFPEAALEGAARVAVSEALKLRRFPGADHSARQDPV
jgi:hypothetical protein